MGSERNIRKNDIEALLSGSFNMERAAKAAGTYKARKNDW
jgi:hypothetical protein